MSKGDVESAGDLVKVIQSLFVDDPTPAINFSSIHKAKGLEADNVFIQRPDLLPMPMAIKSGDPIQIQQSNNLGYVAITRAKKKLTLVAPPPKEEGEESVPVHPTAWASAMGGSAVDQLADIVAPPAPTVAKKKVTKKKKRVTKKKATKKPTPAPTPPKKKKITQAQLDKLLDLFPNKSVASDWEDVEIRQPSLFERVTVRHLPDSLFDRVARR